MSSRLFGYSAADQPDAMISRTQAREAAERIVFAGELGTGVREVVSVDEIHGRAPSIYGFPDLSDFWVAYVARDPMALCDSSVVLVSKASGEIAYAGSAHDEG